VKPQLQPREHALKEDAALLDRHAVNGGPDGGSRPVDRCGDWSI
jgi:hypothetical protein